MDLQLTGRRALVTGGTRGLGRAVVERLVEEGCAVALCAPGVEVVEDGVMAGRVLRAPRGDGGFGYDPLFCADGYDVSTAELSPAEKDAISHRGKALRAIAPHVGTVLAPNA